MEYLELAKEWIISMQTMRKSKQRFRFRDEIAGEDYILYYIYKTKDPSPSRNLENEMSVSSARIARALNSLENKGYISRKDDLLDHSKTNIILTEKGIYYTELRQKEYVDNVVSILKEMGEVDAKEYIRLTSKLSTIIETRESTKGNIE